MRTASLGVIGLAAVLGAGCGGRTEPRVEAGVQTQTLHVNLGAEPRDFDPHTTTLPADGEVIRALMEGLADTDPIDCRPIPGVAKGWETSEDGLTWTIRLRPEARWSNGDPLVAEDFVYAYRRALSPGLAAEYSEQFFCLRNAEEFSAGKVEFDAVGVRAADAHTLILILKAPVPYLPTLLAQAWWFPVHRPTIEKFGRMDQRSTAWTRPENHVGNGAFVLKEWKAGTVVRVAKSPTYWDRDRVRLNAVVFYPMESPAVGDAAFRAGQVHTTRMPVDKVSRYRADPKMSALLYEAATLQTAFLRFNCRIAPLNDPRVRQALSLAIDREQLARRVVQFDQPAFSLTPPNCAGYTADPSVKTDVAEAKRLLAEAGFPSGRGFPTLEVLFYVYGGLEQPVVEALQEMLRANLGVTVSLVKQEMKTAIAARRTGDFQILNSNWIGDYLDPTTFLDLLRSGASNNATGWASAAYDGLLNEASRTMDGVKRYELLRRAEALMLAEAPVAPLFYNPVRFLRHAAVKGWHDNLLDQHPLKAVWLER